MLDVKRLKVLREVAACGSFSAAAESLAYTQSAVSQQIAALEREAGTILLERNARGVRLTDAGRALVDHSEQIIARLAAAEAELEAIAGLRGGRLRMASFPTAGATLMPLAIARFRQRHPGVELSLAQAEPEDSVPRLRAGELDIALLFEPNQLDHGADAIQLMHLLDDPMYIALAADHPLAAKPRLRLKDLAGEPWIQATGACSRLTERACSATGFEPHVAFESDDYLTVQGLVAAGVGVALIPELALGTVREDIVIRPLGPRPEVRRRVMAATADRGYCAPATASMLEVLREVADEYVADREPVAAAS
jgi:DNA-binding transcriptional LysR family regulator